MKIAIIGGGVSGLSLAHDLHLKKIDFRLFEKENSLGGNVHTRKTIHNSKEKYVDLGVNDFNPLTYSRLSKLMIKTRSLSGRVKMNTTFFTSDNYLFNEKNPNDPELAENIKRFRLEAAEVLVNKQYEHYSVEHYFKEKGYAERFLTQYLYPRIQGLFFYPPEGILALPITFVMQFYALQCGFEFQKTPVNIRSNFKGGASTWINNLVKTIPPYKIFKGNSPSITKTKAGYTLCSSGVKFEADIVVFACHADDLYTQYKDILSKKQGEILSTISYANMISVAHCDESYLPVSSHQYSAYNCFVKNTAGSGHTDYTITYNCNAHQNLENNEDEMPSGDDFFFVTVNPIKPIEEHFILKDEQGKNLIKKFRRNICDFKLLDAQAKLKLEQGKNRLYFVGGYTQGIGLHENCLRQSAFIANRILTKTKSSNRILKQNHKKQNFQPTY